MNKGIFAKHCDEDAKLKLVGKKIFFQKFYIQKIINIILFICLLYISWLLHKSMPVYIILILIALIIPLKKIYIILLMALFPILYTILLLISKEFLDISQIWIIQHSGQNYIDSINTFNINWKGCIGLIVNNMPIIYIYIVLFSYPIPQNSIDFQMYKTFLLFAFLVYFLSFLFMGQASIHLQKRFYNTSMFPLAFTVSIFYKHNFRIKQCIIFEELILIKYVFYVILNVLLIIIAKNT
jgi:hypothetical protein